MFISWFFLYKGDNEFIVEVVKIFFDLTLNFEHDFVNVDLGGFFPPRELLFSPVNFWIGFNEPRISQNNLLCSQRSFHKLCMQRLCSFAKTWSIKIPVAPESTRAMVSTFQPFICRVTGMCIVFRLYHTYEVLTIGAITAEMLLSSVKNPLRSL